jgi:hypothetical protein
MVMQDRKKGYLARDAAARRAKRARSREVE